MGNTTEELTTLWGKLSLSEEEGTGMLIQENAMDPMVQRGSYCLVGKLLSDRIIGKDVIKVPLIRIWKTNGRVTFKEVGDNLFLIEFQHDWEKSRILEGRPWTFDGYLISLVEFDGMTPPAELDFDRAAFWVRMSNLPLACMGKDIGMQIGSSVGEVEDIDVLDDGVGWGKFLRVKIVVDLSKPLARGRTITVKNNQFWISFQYEKLPKFCYTCGVIRHGSRGCGGFRGRKVQGMENEAQFGPWLKVGPSTRRPEYGEGRPQYRRQDRDRGRFTMILAQDTTFIIILMVVEIGTGRPMVEVSHCRRNQRRGTKLNLLRHAGV
jgi:hypothetical protein